MYDIIHMSGGKSFKYKISVSEAEVSRVKSLLDSLFESSNEIDFCIMVRDNIHDFFMAAEKYEMGCRGILQTLIGFS